MHIVTGGAWFIGSNLVRRLLEETGDDVVVVDDLTDGHKFRNLAALPIADFLDKDEFLERLDPQFSSGVDCIFHQGACSTTTEWDGRYMMKNNYAYSRTLLHHCLAHDIPLIYASSAAVYGSSPRFSESHENELPLNVYGWSKLLFDRYVQRLAEQASSQVVGLRYFNVYGPNEQHKGSMASVAWHFNQQILTGDEIRLFEGSGGFEDGEQRRDFVYVDDVCAVNLWFLQHRDASGVFNTGTGRSQSFNDVANAVIAWHGRGRIRYIPFPDELAGAYQSFTEADLSKLRSAGCDVSFRNVEAGVRAYLDRLAG
ncbi:MAG TPA: ADP-glyceromanno-heptose 6-epimerase [Woeseiaceae bacterium]|nr:ADP-glyceromanno-heptose 6-epimerase [Woeseiaceae bacterium]